MCFHPSTRVTSSATISVIREFVPSKICIGLKNPRSVKLYFPSQPRPHVQILLQFKWILTRLTKCKLDCTDVHPWKNFIPYFLALGSNAHFRYKKEPQVWKEHEASEWTVDKGQIMKGPHSQEQAQHFHLTAPLSSERSKSKWSHTYETQSRKSAQVSIVFTESSITRQQKHDSPQLKNTAESTSMESRRRSSESSPAQTVSVGEFTATNKTTADEFTNDINHLRAPRDYFCYALTLHSTAQNTQDWSLTL